jgi:hypothetical protein
VKTGNAVSRQLKVALTPPQIAKLDWLMPARSIRQQHRTVVHAQIW